MASNGGLTSPLGVMLIPSVNISGIGSYYWLNPANFNDPSSASSYSFKVEDVLAGRTPTISRIIVSYRDLGVATITLTLSGIDDNQAVQTNSITVNIGTTLATKKVCTLIVGLALSANNLQLTITRLANAGPVSITKIRMEGRVDLRPYA